MSDGIYKGVPDCVVTHIPSGIGFLNVENGYSNVSVSNIYTGNVTNQVLVTPTSGRRIIVKGLTVVAEGTVGEILIKRSSTGQTILPCYVSSQSRQSTSNALNLVFNINETVTVTTTNRGTSNSFVGVSYIEVE